MSLCDRISLRRALRRSPCILAALAFAPMIASTARADPSPTELAVARRLFQEAVEFEQQSRWELAESKLRDALAVKDTPGLRFHLAHCEERLGHLVEAMINYDRARELIAAGARAPDVEELLEPARAALEKRLPTLVIIAPAEVADLQIELDGKGAARSVLGRPAPVDVGSHRILVRAAGYRDFAEQFVISEGERRSVSVNLVPIDAPHTEPTTTPLPPPEARALSAPRPYQESSGSTSGRTYVLAAESAVAVIGIGVGVGFLLVKSTASDRVDRAQQTVDGSGGAGSSGCSTNDSTRIQACSDLHDAVKSYDRARLISTVGLVGAGVGTAAVVLTLVIWPNSSVTPHVNADAHGASAGVNWAF